MHEWFANYWWNRHKKDVLIRWCDTRAKSPNYGQDRHMKDDSVQQGDLRIEIPNYWWNRRTKEYSVQRCNLRAETPNYWCTKERPKVWTRTTGGKGTQKVTQFNDVIFITFHECIVSHPKLMWTDTNSALVWNNQHVYKHFCQTYNNNR